MNKRILLLVFFTLWSCDCGSLPVEGSSSDAGLSLFIEKTTTDGGGTKIENSDSGEIPFFFDAGFQTTFGDAGAQATFEDAGEQIALAIEYRPRRLSGGAKHTCVINSENKIKCWGQGSTDSACSGTTARECGQAIDPEGNFLHVSAGETHTCGINETHAVICWGAGENPPSIPDAGTIGNTGGSTFPNVGQSAAPQQTAFSQVSAGYTNTCAVTQGSTVQCWGGDWLGQTSVPADNNFLQVSSGWIHACGLRKTGEVVCWGAQIPGGCAPFCGQSDPPENEFFVQIAAGGYHTCGLQSQGRILCWGRNGHGQCNPPENDLFEQVTTGEQHSCGLRTDGTITCWGAGNENSPESQIYNEGQSIAPEGSFVEVSAGGLHTCGLKEDGSVICWGYNSRGQTDVPTDL
jgi:alpha-tubulin suppressor-like RCC1 family protein